MMEQEVNQPDTGQEKLNIFEAFRSLPSWIPLLVVALVATIVGGGIIYAVYCFVDDLRIGSYGLEYTGQDKDSKKINEISIDDILLYKHFDKNIFQKNLGTGEYLKLTSYPQPESRADMSMVDLKYVQMIDDSILGYYRCDRWKDMDCGINILNIETLENRQIDITGILGLSFLTEDIFVYSQGTDIYLFEEGSKRLIKSFDYMEYYGTSNPEGAAFNLSFSKNGKYVSAYFPFSGGRRGDSFVFDLYGKDVARARDAFYIDWLNDEEFIFQGIDNQPELRNFIGMYDIKTGEEKELINFLTKHGAYPSCRLLNDKIAYWTNEYNELGEVYIYDVKKDSSKKVADNGYNPIWISDNELLYAVNSSPIKSGMFGDYPTIESLAVYDVAKGTSVNVINSLPLGSSVFISLIKEGGTVVMPNTYNAKVGDKVKITDMESGYYDQEGIVDSYEFGTGARYIKHEDDNVILYQWGYERAQ